MSETLISPEKPNRKKAANNQQSEEQAQETTSTQSEVKEAQASQAEATTKPRNTSWAITKQIGKLFSFIIDPKKQIRYFQKADSSYMLFLSMAALVVWGHVNFLPHLFKSVFPDWTPEMAQSRAWGLSLFLETLIFIFAVKKINIKFLKININTFLKYSATSISFFGFIFELITKWDTMNVWQFGVSFAIMFITAVIPTLAMLGFAKDLLRLAKRKKTTRTNIAFKDNSELQDRIKSFVNLNPDISTIATVFSNFKQEVGETNVRNFLKENFPDRFGKKK